MRKPRERLRLKYEARLPDAETRIVRALIAFAGEPGTRSRQPARLAATVEHPSAERVSCRPETVRRVLKALRELKMIEGND